MHRGRVFMLIAGFTSTAVLAVSGSAGAAAPQTVARWDMNEKAGSAVLVDSGSHHLNGTIGAHVVRNGSTHTFPSIQGGNGGTIDPAHLDLVNSSLLNPGSGNFTVTLRILVGWDTGNVLQKGQTGTAGGFWKVQLDDGAGRILCSFVSPTGSASVWSSVLVNDHKWHVVTCARTPSQVTTTVDGVSTVIKHATGSISNTTPLSIGGKSQCTQTPGHDCDYIVGQLDYVLIQTS